MSISNFPIYNVRNIPEALRKLANDIEAKPDLSDHFIAVFQSSDGHCNFRVFGKDCSRASCVGLLEYAKALIMELKGV